MARKKKGMKSNPYQGMIYTIKIVELFKPCRWSKGAWEGGKKHKNQITKSHFTGAETRENAGFNLMVMGILDNKEFGIIEPFSEITFESQKEALQHLQGSDIPEIFKPFTSRYPMGEMNVQL
jgi:hypothetical protein